MVKYAKIQLDFVKGSDPKADVRIAFDKNDGSWSYIGTVAVSIDPVKPTMNFRWLTETTSNKEFSRVVKHEFGHALGCIHEHQNSVAAIDWPKKMYTRT